MWGKKRQATGGGEGKSLWWTVLLLEQMEAELGWGGKRGMSMEVELAVEVGAEGGGAG
jgi:hypothetical protein